MTEYHCISEWPSVLYNRLLFIQSTYGLAPEDPVQNGKVTEEGFFVATFGTLSVLTGDSNMQSLYETHRDYMLSGLDRGYLTAGGTNSPCASDQSRLNMMFDLYRANKDEKLHDLFNDVANGFAGIRTDGNNWPRHSDSGYDIFANCLGGTFWGTLNMETTLVENLVETYYMDDMDTYHLSTIPEMVWNVIKWISIKQKSDGSFPRDTGGTIVEGYDIVVAWSLSHMYYILKNNGDLTYNGDSIMSLIRGILDKHWVYYQNHYGVRNIAINDSNLGITFFLVPEMSVQGHMEEAVKTGLLNAYTWSQGFFMINTSTDYRHYPIAFMMRLNWFGDKDIENTYKRWL